MTEKRSSSCVRCNQPATMWSGAWLVDGAWIGWCSKDCQKRWIKGDKLASVTTTVDAEEGR